MQLPFMVNKDSQNRPTSSQHHWQARTGTM